MTRRVIIWRPAESLLCVSVCGWASGRERAALFIISHVALPAYWPLFTSRLFSSVCSSLSWHYSLLLVYIQFWLTLSHLLLYLFSQWPSFYERTVPISYGMIQKCRKIRKNNAAEVAKGFLVIYFFRITDCPWNIDLLTSRLFSRVCLSVPITVCVLVCMWGCPVSSNQCVCDEYEYSQPACRFGRRPPPAGLRPYSSVSVCVLWAWLYTSACICQRRDNLRMKYLTNIQHNINLGTRGFQSILTQRKSSQCLHKWDSTPFSMFLDVQRTSKDSNALNLDRNAHYF